MTFTDYQLVASRKLRTFCAHAQFCLNQQFNGSKEKHGSSIYDTKIVNDGIWPKTKNLWDGLF